MQVNTATYHTNLMDGQCAADEQTEGQPSAEIAAAAQEALDSLRQLNGLYLASPSDTYHYIWVRDNCYIALSESDENNKSNGRYEQTYQALLDIFRKYEWKLAYHAGQKPHEVYEYIHPRYSVETMEEIWGPWGNAQNDAIGAFLFGIGRGLRNGRKMLRDATDRYIVELLLEYLQTLEFWQDEDNGMWEENRELHASSVGACTAGMLALMPYFEIDMTVIRKGLEALFDLLPNESVLHETDLSLLSLVYPYQLLPYDMAALIVERVEQKLLRQRGVIRYLGDAYYADDGQEAEWCMGLPWLGLCHSYLGNWDKAAEYLARTEAVMQRGGVIPELYLAKQGLPNENAPLGWANSLYLVLYRKLK